MKDYIVTQLSQTERIIQAMLDDSVLLICAK